MYCPRCNDAPSDCCTMRIVLENETASLRAENARLVAYFPEVEDLRRRNREMHDRAQKAERELDAAKEIATELLKRVGDAVVRADEAERKVAAYMTREVQATLLGRIFLEHDVARAWARRWKALAKEKHAERFGAPWFPSDKELEETSAAADRHVAYLEAVEDA